MHLELSREPRLLAGDSNIREQGEGREYSKLQGITDVVKDYREIADEARRRSRAAKASSSQHCFDLVDMQRVASEAREVLRVGQQLHRNRKGSIITNG